MTDKDICRAVDNGADTVRCLRQLNGLGSQCGRCSGHAKEVIDQALREKTSQNDAVTVVTATGVGVCYP